MSERTAVRTIEEQKDTFIELATKIWNCPETAYTEVNACKWTSELLEKYGFKVETGYAGVPTAIRAVWGSGHPIIGLLGEYDALPGLSQKVCNHKEPVVAGGPGHGCGHNLLGTTCLAAAVGLQAELTEKKLPGTVVFYGCPGEEELTGKVFMARNGAFKDLDLAFAWHGGGANMTSIGRMTGLNSAIFHFKGRTAHAGGDPYNGRSALDAAELMSVGANYLREHVTSDVRIHYSYKEAGTAPNIVPDKAAVWYFVRAFSREAIDDTYNRLVKVAKGAAMMTETEVEIEFLGGCYDMLPNETLANLICDSMHEIELPKWTEEELKFADDLNKQSAMYEGMKAKGMLEGSSIADNVTGIVNVSSYGSSDVGDVTYIVPTSALVTATYNKAAPGHSWMITACGGMSIGHKGMLYGAKVLANAIMKVFEDNSIAVRAKEEFDRRMNGRTYKCPIPAEVPVPQPNR